MFIPQSLSSLIPSTSSSCVRVTSDDSDSDNISVRPYINSTLQFAVANSEDPVIPAPHSSLPLHLRHDPTHDALTYVLSTSQSSVVSLFTEGEIPNSEEVGAVQCRADGEECRNRQAHHQKRLINALALQFYEQDEERQSYAVGMESERDGKRDSMIN